MPDGGGPRSQKPVRSGQIRTRGVAMAGQIRSEPVKSGHREIKNFPENAANPETSLGPSRKTGQFRSKPDTNSVEGAAWSVQHRNPPHVARVLPLRGSNAMTCVNTNGGWRGAKSSGGLLLGKSGGLLRGKFGDLSFEERAEGGGQVGRSGETCRFAGPGVLIEALDNSRGDGDGVAAGFAGDARG